MATKPKSSSRSSSGHGKSGGGKSAKRQTKSAGASAPSARRAAPRARRAGSSETTADHEVIRRWAEERGGTPSCVRGTGGKQDVGLLRIDFPGFSGEDSLQPITWEEFFEKFDEQALALVFQERTADGQPSNFNKLVSRDTAARAQRRSGGSTRRKPGESSRKTTAKSGKSARRGGSHGR